MNERLTININNITATQMKVYRILRTSMGLQRYEAKLTMLGYLLGEETAKITILNYMGLTDKILAITTTDRSEQLEELRHEWSHMRELLQTPPKHQASVKPKA